MAKYVFILIEGSKLSFLKDSQPSLQSDDAWTAAGSPLRLGLEELFRGDVNFAVVDWPRGNNQTDRIKGVANLADCIRRLEREFPDSIYYAIGHSHGGNVGWLALNSNEEVFDRLSGLVCLGTPFICYNSTSIKLGRDSYVQSLSIALIVGGPLFYLLLLASLCSVWHCIFGYEFPWRPLLKVGVPVFMATPVALALGRANWVNTKLRRARSMLNELSNAPEKPELRDKLLIVRSIGDETGALPAFYVASWYISRKSEGFERRYPGADALSESESKRIRNLVYGFFSSVRNRPVDGFKPSIVRDTSVCGALDFVCLYSGMDTAARGGLPESPFASLHRFRSSISVHRGLGSPRKRANVLCFVCRCND
jgi:pimeloyl-ACP methyl ester carboxylesterase